MAHKTTAFFFLLILIIVDFNFGQNNQVLFKLPVRFDKDITEWPQTLKKEDFQLVINNKPAKILQLEQIKRSLAIQSGIGRNFLLSFHILDYDQHIENGISYFLSEIIDRKDMLVVASPLNVYRIRLSPNKEGISRKIKQIISKDCQKFRKLKAQAEQQIINTMQSIRRSLTFGFTRFFSSSSLGNKLKLLEKSFIQYKKKIIRPDLTKFQSMSEPFRGRGGNKWFIHIQQKKIFSLIPRLNKYLEKLRLHFYRPLFKEAMKFKNGVLYSNLFPFEQLKNIIVQNNFCIHTIIQDHPVTVPPTLGLDLKKMTESLGGMYFSSSSIQSDFERIKNHQDQYLELNFPFDGRLEGKTIQLRLAGKEKGLIYPTHYNKKEIATLVSIFARKRIGIEYIVIDRDKIIFSIDSYQINQHKNFAIIQIKIKVFDEQSNCLFRTQKTLRASKKRTLVSVRVPRINSEKVRLNIEAYDLLANNFTSVEHNLTENQQIPYFVDQ